MSQLGNFVAFQATWFASVLGAGNGLPWLGPLVLALWLAAHLSTVGRSETSLLVAAALLGFGLDSLLVGLGAIAFPNSSFVTAPSPLWMIGLWIAFACTLKHSLAWLRPYPWLTAAFGAIGGSLAYLGGSKLGALEVSTSLQAIAVIGLMWAVVTPLLFVLADRLTTSRTAHARSSVGESA